MRKIILILAVLLPVLVRAQVKYIAVEAKYLAMINGSGDRALIADNLRNAEMVADSIIAKHLTDVYASQVLANLARSYYLTGDYHLAFLSVVRYLLFVPEGDMFYDQMTGLLDYVCARMGKNCPADLKNDILSRSTKFNTWEGKMNYLLQTAIALNDKHLKDWIFEKINLYQQTGRQPLSKDVLRWAYYVNIGISPVKASKLIVKYPSKDLPDVTDITTFSPKHRFCVRLHLLTHKKTNL